MEPIEQKIIQGISAKTLVTIIICTGSIMLTVLGTYYGLKADITDVRASKDSESKLNDLKMRVMDQRLDATEISLKDLIKRMDENKK